jgi:hypothetical protein
MLMVAERAEVEPEAIQNLARATIYIAFAGKARSGVASETRAPCGHGER